MRCRLNGRDPRTIIIASPPVELWPEIRQRVPVPGDGEELLLAGLARNA